MSDEGGGHGLIAAIAVITVVSLVSASFYLLIYAPKNTIQCSAGQTVGCTLSSTTASSYSSSYSLSSSSTCSTSTTTSGNSVTTVLNCNSTTTATKIFCPASWFCFDIKGTFSIVGAAAIAVVVQIGKPKRSTENGQGLSE